MTAKLVPHLAGSSPTFNDRLVSTVTGGASDLLVRTSNGRTARIVRASDGAELADLGSIAAATARANEMVSRGVV